MLRALFIAIVVSFGSAGAEKVDWSEYIDKSPQKTPLRPTPTVTEAPAPTKARAAKKKKVGKAKARAKAKKSKRRR